MRRVLTIKQNKKGIVMSTFSGVAVPIYGVRSCSSEFLGVKFLFFVAGGGGGGSISSAVPLPW